MHNYKEYILEACLEDISLVDSNSRVLPAKQTRLVKKYTDDAAGIDECDSLAACCEVVYFKISLRCEKTSSRFDAGKKRS
jgi:hypothetical protein